MPITASTKHNEVRIFADKYSHPLTNRTFCYLLIPNAGRLSAGAVGGGDWETDSAATASPAEGSCQWSMYLYCWLKGCCRGVLVLDLIWSDIIWYQIMRSDRIQCDITWYQIKLDPIWYHVISDQTRYMISDDITLYQIRSDIMWYQINPVDLVSDDITLNWIWSDIMWCHIRSNLIWYHVISDRQANIMW